MPEAAATPLVLDTHVWIWAMEGVQGVLSQDAVAAIEAASHAGSGRTVDLRTPGKLSRYFRGEVAAIRRCAVRGLNKPNSNPRGSCPQSCDLEGKVSRDRRRLPLAVHT